jgi:hypothetical protein
MLRPKCCPTLSCGKEPACSAFQDFSMEMIAPKVLALSKIDDALKTIDAVNGSAANENEPAIFEWNAVLGPANTNENLQNFFLPRRSGLKIMYGERVGIQVLQHNTVINTCQIKTREKPSPKPVDTAEVGALECYIKAALAPDFNASRTSTHCHGGARGMTAVRTVNYLLQVIQKPPMTEHRYI